jgi:hemin uptake protein HemP
MTGMANEQRDPPEGPLPEGSLSDPGTRTEDKLPRVRSPQLFGGSNRLVIDHEGQEYVLLITRNGKLVLNRWR